jgi:hypothetical protein
MINNINAIVVITIGTPNANQYGIAVKNIPNLIEIIPANATVSMINASGEAPFTYNNILMINNTNNAIIVKLEKMILRRAPKPFSPVNNA